MNNFYTDVKTTALYAAAFAAVVAGYRIYSKWSTGEPVVTLIANWLLSMIIVVGLVSLVDYYIFGGRYNSLNIPSMATGLARESHSASIIIGVIFATVMVINIYQKYTSGEDVIELVYRWVGSIFFLLFFGIIINALM